MPTISMFYGILIRMFFYDTDKHHVPHIHAELSRKTGASAGSTLHPTWKRRHLPLCGIKPNLRGCPTAVILSNGTAARNEDRDAL